ncbi:hypothetical protein [Pseudodesulfovibrio methanolicus]|uniref:Transposase DDE domain-containing protein n=1 Tax=Pseudodesulfovibrio methanolicus TaxID=3126690 RepID=A0ABZ2J0G1_9BACT
MRYFLSKKTKPRDFGQKKRRASFREEARRFNRFFCPKSHTGTAEGVLVAAFRVRTALSEANMGFLKVPPRFRKAAPCLD